MAEQDEYVDVLLYSDDATTRQAVIASTGRRAAKGLPLLRWDETATGAAVMTKVNSNRYALLVLDGEAAKVGGMSLARSLKEEVFECPPILVLTGRPQDRWLARWSLADGDVPAPYDPIELQRAIASLLQAATK